MPPAADSRADVRAERCREWAAELPAILGDQDIRPPFLRALRALTFCMGISRTTRELSRSARASARRTTNPQWRNSAAMRTRPPDVAARALLGLFIWLIIVVGLITLLRMNPDPQGWPVTLGLGLAIGFDALCLVQISAGCAGALPAQVGVGAYLPDPDPARRHHVPEHRPYRPATANAARRR